MIISGSSTATDPVPTSKRPRKSRRGDRTRASLVKEATARFTEVGFDRATTVDIAHRAGVAEGTLFLHFGSKKGLLLEVMQAYYDALVEDLAEESSRGGTAEGRLRHLVRFWVGRMHWDWRLMRVFGQHGRFARDAEMVTRFAEMNRKVTRFFGGIFEDLKAAGVIRPELPTYILRNCLFGATEHLLLAIETTGRQRDLPIAADHLCEVLLGCGSASPHAVQLEDLDHKLDQVLAHLSPAHPSPAEDPSSRGS